MLVSMTGYGRAVCTWSEKNLVIEIKALNSKQFDFSLRVPTFLYDKEHEIRQRLQQKLERGKINLNISFEQTAGLSTVKLNTEQALPFVNQLKAFHESIGQLQPVDYVGIVASIPEFYRSENVITDEESWNTILQTIDQALESVVVFRQKEGEILAQDIRNRVNRIIEIAGDIEPFEKERIEHIKDKLNRELLNLQPHSQIDSNRFQQELIYYIEKLDITEEKVRLHQHCRYFLETLEKEMYAGRKLGFIIQEMGREINTLGSKANHAHIQQLVVMMKDELEKIKEQLLNVL